MRHSPKSSSSSWYVFVWMLSAMGALPKKSLMPKVLPLMRFVFLPEKRTIIKTARSRDVRLRPLRDTLPQACATKRSPKLVKKREKGRPYGRGGRGAKAAAHHAGRGHAAGPKERRGAGGAQRPGPRRLRRVLDTRERGRKGAAPGRRFGRGKSAGGAHLWPPWSRLG